VSTRKTPTELADMIRQNLDLDPIREFLSAAVSAIDIDPLRPGPRPRLVAPSVTLDDVTVAVALTASNPSYLGYLRPDHRNPDGSGLDPGPVQQCPGDGPP
jgi:hypothetical protein